MRVTYVSLLARMVLNEIGAWLDGLCVFDGYWFAARWCVKISLVQMGYTVQFAQPATQRDGGKIPVMALGIGVVRQHGLLPVEATS
ncbi:hypothetical protein E2542_SST03356 [Spatholobus suberectus]|nr:hypothetical protein E2542_SST03356 [Spatholobus suberectus]